jgi:ABC-2 type transport system ATP-binding protein
MIMVVKTTADETALMAEGLVKRYPGCTRPAVDGLDLRVSRGEIFGLLGPNGAGKSTTIGMFSTLLAPSAGRVTFGGAIGRRRLREVRATIGLVPQEIALFRALTARANLHYFGRMYGLKGRDLAVRVRASLELVGLENQADQRVATFSGGMQRRANLAAGLVHGPRLLFLDEPTVGVDAQSRALILERLGRLRAEGLTMIYTTHYMEEAETLCDTVAIMDNGGIVACGRAADLRRQVPGARNLGEVFLELTGKALRDA